VPVGEQDPEVESAVRAHYAAQRRAMVAGDADALGALLADGFTLTHLTGYRQPKAEWLADVRSGAMAYHSMDDVAVDVDVSSHGPVLTVRTRTAATIWGGHATWPLQLRIRFVPDGTGWLAADTVASLW
jgi:hypothetical protein